MTVSFFGTDDPNPLLLYKGWRDGECREFEPQVGDPDVALIGVGYHTECPSEIYVFAEGSKAVGLVTDPTKLGSELWFTAALSSKSLSIELLPPIELPLKLWLVADQADLGKAMSQRDRLIEQAYPILHDRGTGMTLDTSSSVLASGSISPDCADFGQIISQPGYDAARLNVYFVEFYKKLQNNSGYTCVDVAHPEIIFIAWGKADVQDPTLAHELGHALGLIAPPIWGHTFLVPGFTSGNFMASEPQITNASIGQLFRLNFSSDSWLNSDMSAFKRSEARPCQKTWTAAPECPALTLFADGGWPRP
jgi:hypothetical protein